MEISGTVPEKEFRTIIDADLDFRTCREVFDTIIAPQLLGIEQIGLAALIEMVAAVEAKVEKLLALR